MQQRTCSIDGCPRSPHGRGWCTYHYNRWIRHGDPLAGIEAGPPRPPTSSQIPTDPAAMAAYLMQRAQRVGECWVWQGHTNDKGYGRQRYQGRTRPVHRLMYELTYGAIPDELDIDHLCRVRGCLNVDHLEPVTRRENLRRSTTGWAEALRTDRCRRGHDLTDEANIYRPPGNPSWRYCRACRNENKRAARADAPSTLASPTTLLQQTSPVSA